MHLPILGFRPQRAKFIQQRPTLQTSCHPRFESFEKQ